MFISELALDHVASIPPYEPGTPIETVARQYRLDAASLIKLASNENPLGMSPAAREAAKGTLSEGARYPDNTCHKLTSALANRMEVFPTEIIVGAGSVHLMLLAARAFLDANTAAIVPQFAFAAYRNIVRSVGAKTIVVPANNFGHDLDKIAAAVDDSVRIVFVASVNNPTGQWLLPEEIERFLDSIPEHVLVVLDEAYREYMPAAVQGDYLLWHRRYPNLLVLRTFSKIYGLASLRVGYGIGNEKVIEILQRLQTPFGVSTMAQAAATAALDDREFVERSRNLIAQERARLCADLDEAGFSHLPSAGNFVLVRVSDGPETYRALIRQRVIVRPVANYGLKEWIRVTVGLPDENDQFLNALREQ